MATLLKVLNNLADIKSAGVLHFASELRVALLFDAGPSNKHAALKESKFKFFAI
jgi:hypothetical protein